MPGTLLEDPAAFADCFGGSDTTMAAGKEPTLSPRMERMIRTQAKKRPVSRLVQRLGTVQTAGRKSAAAKKKAAPGKAPPQPKAKE